jgi:hypothetical protein
VKKETKKSPGRLPGGESGNDPKQKGLCHYICQKNTILIALKKEKRGTCSAVQRVRKITEIFKSNGSKKRKKKMRLSVPLKKKKKREFPGPLKRFFPVALSFFFLYSRGAALVSRISSSSAL